MVKFRLLKVPNDAIVQAIGNFFRPINGSRWAVNILLSSEWSHLTLSHAPLLARKRILNPSERYHPSGWEQHFQIDNTADWRVTQIGDCPITGYRNKRDADQFCFTFSLTDETQVYLPQFELARALFLHDTYLSRAALEPSFLKNDFDIRFDNQNDFARINVLPTSTYPLAHLNEPNSRNMLSWVLLDPEARYSYESIGKHEKLHGSNDRIYRKWNFQFTPPNLVNCRFSIRGHFDKDTKNLFVFQIDNIGNLPADLPKNIEFFHPALASGSTKGGKWGAHQGLEACDEFEIDDENTTNTDTQPVVFQLIPVNIAFANPFQTQKTGNRAGASYLPSSGGGAPANGSHLVGLEAGMAGEGLPSADWNTVNDVTDDAHLFENKFSCFFKMMELLINNFNCLYISRTIRKLPKIPRCAKHLLFTDGTNRCLSVVVLQVNNSTFHLLEVDTSDGETALSTQLLCLKSPHTWAYDIKQIEHRLLKGSLKWPKNFLHTLCGQRGHVGVPHPQTKAENKGLLDPDSITGWAERIFWAMHRIR